MNNFINKKVWCLSLLGLLVFGVPAVQAVSLKIDGPLEPVLVNQDFRVDLLVDAEGEDINAVGGKVAWPSELEIRSILTAESIVSLWAQRPYYDGESLIFSGVMPGGYRGSYSNKSSALQPGVLMSLVLRARKATEVKITFAELSVYPNDGSGEALRVAKPEFDLVAYGNPATDTGKATVIKNDKIAPQDLVASIERSPDVADNQWFVVFAARDQESGIANFYIAESKTARPEGDWLAVGSPFVLTDQSRTKYVLIKAVDLNGNETTVTLPPLSSEVPSFENRAWLVKVLVFVILVVVIGLSAWLIKKFRQRYER